MKRERDMAAQGLYGEPELQLREIEFEASYMPRYEGVHQGTILVDQWGNEWDDTDDFSELDFRLVDGE